MRKHPMPWPVQYCRASSNAWALLKQMLRQLGETLMLTELLHGRSGGRAELDRLVSEDAAQPQADHVALLSVSVLTNFDY